MYQKYARAALLFTSAAVLLGFQNGTASNDEADVKNISKNYSEAFNKLDAEKLSALWAPDAVYVNITTRQALSGKDEIAEYFRSQFADDKDESLKITLDSVKITGPGKAIQKGIAEVTVKGKTEKSAFLAELTKLGNNWLLQKVTEVDIQAPPSHYEQLKELEWMIGQWANSNDDIHFTSKASWDSNKNFINTEIKMTILDQVDFEGHQIIGWDPDKKKIRSWIFDSDGGFGEGIWTKDGNKWHVSSVFTLPDGRKGTASNTYTKIDDKTFTFSSEDRDIDGKMLPNTPSIKINKMP